MRVARYIGQLYADTLVLAPFVAPTPTLPRACAREGDLLLPLLAGEGWDGGLLYKAHAILNMASRQGRAEIGSWLCMAWKPHPGYRLTREIVSSSDEFSLHCLHIDYLGLALAG